MIKTLILKQNSLRFHLAGYVAVCTLSVIVHHNAKSAIKHKEGLCTCQKSQYKNKNKYSFSKDKILRSNVVYSVRDISLNKRKYITIPSNNDSCKLQDNTISNITIISVDTWKL